MILKALGHHISELFLTKFKLMLCGQVSGDKRAIYMTMKTCLVVSHKVCSYVCSSLAAVVTSESEISNLGQPGPGCALHSLYMVLDEHPINN